MKKKVTVTHQPPVTTPKPLWLRKIHASGIHHCPALDCPRCQALLVRSS
jgi:hypothetical protein